MVFRNTVKQNLIFMATARLIPRLDWERVDIDEPKPVQANRRYATKTETKANHGYKAYCV